MLFKKYNIDNFYFLLLSIELGITTVLYQENSASFASF